MNGGGAIKNGYGLIRRKNNNNRGRDNEIFFHFSGVFHPKNESRNEKKSNNNSRSQQKSSFSQDNLPAPIKSGDEVSFDIEDDQRDGDKGGQKKESRKRKGGVKCGLYELIVGWRQIIVGWRK